MKDVGKRQKPRRPRWQGEKREKGVEGRREVPVLTIVAARSNTGKTTLIEGLIECLKSRGYRVGVLKHDIHRLELDKKGKDSYRFAEAGAHGVILTAPRKIIMIQQLEEDEALEMERVFALFPAVDIILIEGYKDSGFPKLEVYREAVGSGLLYRSPDFDSRGFLAIASDVMLDVDIPVLPLNEPAVVAGFIEERMMTRGKGRKLT